METKKTQDASAAQNAAKLDAERVGWTEGLTLGEVVQKMEITVDKASPQTSTANASVQLNTTGDDQDQLYIYWWVPKALFDKHLGSGDGNGWVVQKKVDSDEWKTISNEIKREVITGSEYTYYKFSFFGMRTYTGNEKIITYKIRMTDNNDQEYENIVSFMVTPQDRKLQITLQEAEAAAPSTLWIAHIGSKIFDHLWNVKEVKLPASTTYLPANHNVIFMMEADFTGLGYAEQKVVRYSNTSFCRVTSVEAPTGVEARFKYAFEDLPLTEVASEGSGQFDYNDLVFHVDVMKP